MEYNREMKKYIKLYTIHITKEYLGEERTLNRTDDIYEMNPCTREFVGGGLYDDEMDSEYG